MPAGWSHLAGPAVPVGGGTGQEMVAGDLAPTPAAGAATTAECPVHTKDNGANHTVIGRRQRSSVEETSGVESRRGLLVQTALVQGGNSESRNMSRKTKKACFRGCFLNEVSHGETDCVGSQYLGSELNRL